MERNLTDDRILEELIEECEELLKNISGSETVLAVLGEAYFCAGKYIKARHCFEEVLSLNPGNLSVHNSLGKVLKAEGELHAAKKEFDLVLKKRNYADAHKNLGDIYVEMGLPDKAFFEYKTACEINPFYLEATIALVELYEEMNMYREALEICKIVVKERFIAEHKFDRSGIRSALARIYHEQEFYDAAIMHYTAVLEKHPGYVDVHYNLGMIYKKMGKIDSAMRYFKNAIDLNPNHQRARDEYWACAEIGG